ncbi:hypothetical protein L6452_20240 [Arctium lappa]|uniref:Uncharacterized protein n=1 Tax=Arctium lappa TaxID=4217 RepID=A0ACB9BCP7_ARCLA|nr:hypothetical protein L6452_20240 [Arctium lappa]
MEFGSPPSPKVALSKFEGVTLGDNARDCATGHSRVAKSRPREHPRYNPGDIASDCATGQGRVAMFWKNWLEDSDFFKEAQVGIKSRFSLNLARFRMGNGSSVFVKRGVLVACTSEIGLEKSSALFLWIATCFGDKYHPTSV